MYPQNSFTMRLLHRIRWNVVIAILCYIFLFATVLLAIKLNDARRELEACQQKAASLEHELSNYKQSEGNTQ